MNHLSAIGGTPLSLFPARTHDRASKAPNNDVRFHKRTFFMAVHLDVFKSTDGFNASKFSSFLCGGLDVIEHGVLRAARCYSALSVHYSDAFQRLNLTLNSRINSLIQMRHELQQNRRASTVQIRLRPHIFMQSRLDLQRRRR